MGAKFAGQYSSKDGRRDRLMFLAAAGLAFSLLIILFLVNQKSVEANNPVVEPVVAAATVGTVTLFVPTRNIRAGSKLTEADFRDVYWPRNTVPQEAVRDLSEIRGKYAKVDLQQDYPLRRSNLTDERLTVTLPITPGMRAVTIEVDAQAGIEGWALPGSKVDVILTYVQDGNLTSKVIVQNARVLSYAGSATAPDESLAPRMPRNVRSGSTITLEVSPGDALTIATSKALGTLGLLMRAPEDDKATATTEVNRSSIDGGNISKGHKRNDCNRGVMRIDGREYMIDCDGSITQVTNGNEP